MKTTEIAKKIITIMTAFTLIAVTIVLYQPEMTVAAPKNRIVLEKKYKVLYAGESYTMKAAAFYKDGKLQASAKKKYNKKQLSYQYFRFSSTNRKVATVSRKGLIKAKKKGRTTIIMSHIYDRNIKVTVKLQVKAKKKGKITLAHDSAVLGVGNTVKIAVKSVKNMGGKDMKYISSDKKIAVVSDKGVVTGKSAGTAKITVISALNKKNKTTFRVNVKSQDLLETEWDPTGESKIILAQNEVILAPESSFDGESGHVNCHFCRSALENKKSYGQAQIRVRRVSGLSSSAVQYRSSNPSVAEVSDTGFVTPKCAGTAIITVASKTNPNVAAEYKVMVKNLAAYILYQDFDKLRLTPNEQEKEYADRYRNGYRTCNLDFEVYPETADNRNYKVTSDNEDVIQPEMNYEYGLSDCVLILKGKGNATLTIQSDDGYVTEKWSIQVGDADRFYGVGVY